MHRVEDKVSAFVCKSAVRKQARIHRYGEDACSDGCPHTHGGVLHDEGLGSAYSSLLQAHQVGLGVRLATAHILARDHEIFGEDLGEGFIQPPQERGLRRACDDKALHVGELGEYQLDTRECLARIVLVEELCLALIQPLRLLGGGIAAESTLVE